eukprot:TRINITY_DN63495_c0_g1_i1.p1 TRINITY_DN63495_c0_g1~~TRINITY_DN63495_c0_g1_i1.p1  ORF type:complete len:816 (-),score=131.53 TRINITY_DN63495_c0_g1_i1:5-2338(-)
MAAPSSPYPRSATSGICTNSVQSSLTSRSALHSWYLEVGPEGARSAVEALSASAQRALCTCLEERLQSCEEKDEAPACWVAAALATALPLLRDALPREESGACVVPHRHPLKKEVVPETRRAIMHTGRLVYVTNKCCDNCDKQIFDNEYWCCDAPERPCEVDFCKDCYTRMQELFTGKDMEHAMWMVRFVTAVASHMLETAGPPSREALVRVLAFDWPPDMFEQLVRAVVDVADASVVHIEDNSDIEGGTDFWHTIGLLQILFAANQKPMTQTRLGVFSEGPRMPEDNFILRGIDKCECISDHQRWTRLRAEGVEHMHDRVIQACPFTITSQFTCFLAHSNLVPFAFRRQSVMFDVCSKQFEVMKRRFTVNREPALLLKDLMTSLGQGFFPNIEVQLRGLQKAPELNGKSGKLREFEAASGLWVIKLEDGTEKKVKPEKLEHCEPLDDNKWESLVGQPLLVKFRGEDGSGPGVNREFLRLALQSTLETSDTENPLWEYNSELRTYWFGDSAMDENTLAAFRACGALLGHAILHDVFLPAVFPQPLYMLLLRDLQSPHSRPLVVADLAKVYPSVARGLEQLVEYDGDAIGEVYSLNWPRTDELQSLPRNARSAYVQEYVDWFFTERFSASTAAFCQGFRAVVGQSQLLRQLISPQQLEQVICGIEKPMDVAAVRRGAVLNGWPEASSDYLDDFWQVVGSFSEDELGRFAVFVCSSTRMPSKGWADLNLTVQKNGEGDDRLPTAYTCFNLLLLPLYSSREVLRARLLQALDETQGFGLD